jgi:hypothetical protein
MPQIARTDDKKPTTEVRSTGARNADATSAVTEKVRDQAHEVQATAVNLAEKTSAQATAAVDQMARHFPRSSASRPGPVSDLAGFWQDLIKAQIEHNLDAFRKLTAARDWPERLTIQNSYIAGNLARMAEAASRCLQLSGAMAAKMPTTGNAATDGAR